MLGRRRRVLVLDDDPSIQRLLSAVVRRAGFRADVVSGGSEAIALIRQYDYAVMLLDLMTPTDGGLTVIAHLRQHRPALLPRVILVTASPESLLRTVAGEIATIIRKPFEQDELLAAVRRVAGGAA